MTELVRVSIAFRGVVQGVGFRPAIYRHAADLNLTGWVINTPDGAAAEIEGPRERAERFLVGLASALPPRAALYSVEATWLDPVGYESFEIRESLQTGQRTATVPPDIAACAECIAEMNDPSDRRHRYPFINCTNCGPRYSIIERIPYDRPNTTMARFVMCPACQAEYDDPLNRRFHAQPNACPACGPHVDLWSPDGRTLAEREEAVGAAIEALLSGRIVAVKGIGGFHLMALASDSEALHSLRTRKRREEKPLALMCPTIESVLDLCEMGPLEERALTGPEHPIVLLRKRARPARPVSDLVAPGNPYLGIMLPYTPLHHLLMTGVGQPLVATSGNVSDEPICTDEHDALQRLAGIADLFLVHNRPIRRHVDDSIVRIVAGQEQVLRRARGFAPLPVALPSDGPVTMAVGAHLKNAVALAIGDQAYISQHIGDLDTAPARDAHVKVLDDLSQLYGVTPELIVHDAHPDYASTMEARRRAQSGLSLAEVQHHYAHVFGCMAENALGPPVLGVAWDGTGLGDDGTIWGGEFLLVGEDGFRRVARLRPFRLPGGDAAMREPRRSALGVLHAMGDADAIARFRTDDPDWDASVMPVLQSMLRSGVNSPITTSVGRLFDAVASLIGLRHVSRFEGQAAMELEWLIRNDVPPEPYRLVMQHAEPVCELDWRPLLAQALHDIGLGVAPAAIARGFHDALIRGIVDVAVHAGAERIVLSGGCMQNRYLTEGALAALGLAGLKAYIHQRVPPNDGGIALGQIAASRGNRDSAA